MTATHPLDMLTGDEISRAAKILRESGRYPNAALFAHMVLHEPEKEMLARWQPNDPVDRQVRVVVVPGPTMDLHEVVVSVTKGEIVDWRDHADMRPALLNDRGHVRDRDHEGTSRVRRGAGQAGDHRHGHGADRPVAAGVFGYECEAGRRITRCISFVRSDATDNGYARPIEGLTSTSTWAPTRSSK